MLIAAIVSLSLTIFYGLLLWIYANTWKNIPLFIAPSTFVAHTTVSVVVAMRNEEQNIESCIASLLNQRFPKHLLQIIVVDDNSTDQTLAIARKIAAFHTHINVLERNKAPQNYPEFKKGALMYAIDQAHGRLVVATDADCHFDPEWLNTLVAFYQTHQPKLISSPVVFHPAKSVFHQLQAIEFSGLNVVGASSIQLKMPNMCNGANLCFEKEVFLEVNGYHDNHNLASGDDEFLMHKIAKIYPKKVLFLKSKQAMVRTIGQETLQDFYYQRKRWVSKTSHYHNTLYKLFLVLMYAFNLSIILNLVVGIVALNLFFVKLFGVQIVLKIVVEWIYYQHFIRFYEQEKLLKWLPLLQLPHIVYVVLLGTIRNIGTYKWKGRVAQSK